MRTDISKINKKTSHKDLTEALMVYNAGTSRAFHTGEWRNNTPVWKEDACRQCLLCTPCCPDSSIPVTEGKREDFDYDHCKGCGICASVCPFQAIEMQEGSVLTSQAKSSDEEEARSSGKIPVSEIDEFKKGGVQ